MKDGQHRPHTGLPNSGSRLQVQWFQVVTGLLEGQASPKHLVEGDSQRPDVSSNRVVAPAEQDLRAGVLAGSTEGSTGGGGDPLCCSKGSALKVIPLGQVRFQVINTVTNLFFVSPLGRLTTYVAEKNTDDSRSVRHCAACSLCLVFPTTGFRRHA